MIKLENTEVMGWEHAIKTLHLKGYLDREIAEQLGCSREVVSRKIREMNLR